MGCTSVQPGPSSSIRRNGIAPAFGPTAWLVLASLLAHVTEELPRFPEWATRHFGTTTPRFFIISHIPIVAIVAWIAFRAARRHATSRDTFALILAAAAFATNTLFHAAATLAFREYSPGLVTSLLYLPIAAYLGVRAKARFGSGLVLRAAIAGVIVSVLVTATLWLEVPI